MRRRIAIALGLSLALVGLFAGCGREDAGRQQEVTLHRLLATPEAYSGRQVVVEGFYYHGFEIIVLSEGLDYSGYAEGHLRPTGGMVWVEGGIPIEVYDRLHRQQMMGPLERYGKIRVRGRFEHGGRYGHLGQYGVQIVPLEVDLLEWSPPAGR